MLRWSGDVSIRFAAESVMPFIKMASRPACSGRQQTLRSVKRLSYTQARSLPSGTQDSYRTSIQVT